MSSPEKEPLIPWRLLFSRTGRMPAEESDGDGNAVLSGAGSRPMTEKEGRSAFLFWIAAGAVLCILVAICAVSCGRHAEGTAGIPMRAVWIGILILAVTVILAVSAADIAKAWKAQNKKTKGKKPAEKKN